MDDLVPRRKLKSELEGRECLNEEFCIGRIINDDFHICFKIIKILYTSTMS